MKQGTKQAEKRGDLVKLERRACRLAGAESDGDYGLVWARNSVRHRVRPICSRQLSPPPALLVVHVLDDTLPTAKMLGLRLAAEALLRRTPFTVSSVRAFSASRVAEAGYKLKSHSGAKKRWRSLGASKVFKRVRPLGC